VGPRDLLELLRLFSLLFCESRCSLVAERRRTANGLAVLQSAGRAVSSLKASLGSAQAQLAQQSATASAKLSALLAEQSACERSAAAAQALAQRLEAASAEAQAREAQVAAELAVVEPLLASARSAVAGITRQHLDELRSLASPPAPVRLCLEAVLTLLQGAASAEGSGEERELPAASMPWAEVRRVIKGQDFIPSVVGLVASSISPRLRRAVSERYASSKDFSYERCQGASRACGPLFSWISSQLQYSAMCERVLPLREAAAGLAREQASLASEAAECSATVGRLQASIELLRREYSSSVGACEALQAQTQQVAARAGAAEALLESLSRERQRWQASLSAFPQRLLQLAPCAALAAARLLHLPRAPAAQR
jgi:dynein heavy chain 1